MDRAGRMRSCHALGTEGSAAGLADIKGAYEHCPNPAISSRRAGRSFSSNSKKAIEPPMSPKYVDHFEHVTGFTCDELMILRPGRHAVESCLLEVDATGSCAQTLPPPGDEPLRLRLSSSAAPSRASPWRRCPWPLWWSLPSHCHRPPDNTAWPSSGLQRGAFHRPAAS